MKEPNKNERYVTADKFKVPVTLYFRIYKTQAKGVTNQRNGTTLSIIRLKVKKFTVNDF